MTAICTDRGMFLYVVLILVQNGNGEGCTQIRKNGHYSCGGRNLTYIPTSIPSSVEMLDFSFNFLPTLQRTVFPQLYNLKLLDLTRCHIHHITDDAFHNVKNVTTLILTGNPISYTGLDGLNSLHKLHRLVLVDTGLSSLNVQFSNLTELRELNVGTNNVQSVALPPFMINFRDFSSLDLHANNISILRVNDTNVLRQMKGNITLILSRNPILFIEPGAFQNLHLRELNIRSAFISLDAQRDGLKALVGLNVGKLIIGSYRAHHAKTTETNDLDGLCLINYEEFYFYQNQWLDLSSHVFRCMVNATKITLKRGRIRVIEPVSFRQLKELYIGKNGLEEIPQLSNIQSLEKFVVVDNDQVLFRGLRDMPSLRHVDLSRNLMSLRSCCFEYFRDTPNIRHINLSLNANIMLLAKPFSGLDLLEVLDFHHTEIGVVGQFGLLQNLKYLKYLDLSYTSNTFGSTSSFYGLTSLKVLKIAGNAFQKEKGYLFENLIALEVLDMSNCGIDRLVWRDFRDLQRLQHLLLSQNRLMVLDFLAQTNLPSLTRLALDQNGITSIPQNTLQNLPKNLSIFDISFNPINCLCTQRDFIQWIIEHQKMFPKPHNVLCKTLQTDSKMRAIDFDVESCIYAQILTVVLSMCAVLLFVFASVLAYRFQFYLRYSCVLLRGYRASRQQECSYDAFVIYSSKDESWVMDELVENLENGIPPIHLCLHVRDFEAGKAITSNIIDEGIMGSRKIIVVISKHFIESSWCRFEFEVAQSWLVTQGYANIIIIILEDVEEEKTKKVFGLHKHLKKNTYLKWSGNPISNMRFWIRLRKAVMS
ncbi:toll-like receptor 4 [Colossoma macropomum]|uniref:toll-like receptor 4 n=1 Tax=Colossoma macropomum TaxID=42526 RepID=UPI0018642E13|nr:toll-like receptor 4 [Colossoma macropomum]